MKTNKVYFVLYIVLVVELLAVITERNILQEMEEELKGKMISTISEIYKKDIELTVPEKYSEYTLGTKNNNKILMSVLNLFSEDEKKNVEVNLDIKDNSKVPYKWPKGGISLGYEDKNYKLYKDNGNIVFENNIKISGKFNFIATCNVERVLPTYLPEELLNELKIKIGDKSLTQKSKPEFFSVNVKVPNRYKAEESETMY